MTIAVLSIALLFCIILSAFFSSSEMAYSSCNRLRLEHHAEEGNSSAKLALKITDQFEDTLSAVLIGNNLVNIASSSLGSVMVIVLTGSDKLSWAATLILTLLIIIFGETIPKITAKKNANRLALRFAWPIRILTILLKPFILLVRLLVQILIFWIKPVSSTDEEAVEELQSLIETAEDEDVLDEERSELVQAAIDFSDICAYEVMTARVDVKAIDIEDSWEDILVMAEESSFSRLPVYEGSIDNIIGILYLNHFLKALTEGQQELRSLLMKPCYVYKTMKLPAVMAQLRHAKQHLAVVCDEYGGTLGVVSMEDVLEQIVGDIWDETDPLELESVCRLGDQLELDGDMPITDFLEELHIPESKFDADSDTLGGWCIESFDGRFPEAGESFHFQDYTITVLKMEGRRVDRVKVTKSSEKS